ncbi:hypothetical protein [Nocardia anaemiae]|uniref:hypothetical protein n=1 Tax=Nocardia anaemiae TaxID=263910 RepID=UPI0007A526AD|nr:hypothetical protein [Nocardia anaemiae]
MQRFEVDGADTARELLTAHGIEHDAAQRIWTAIALHSTPDIPEHMAPRSLWSSPESKPTSRVSATTTSTAPTSRPLSRPIRPDFKRQRLAAFTKGFAHRPDSTFGTVNADALAHCAPSFPRTDFVEVILGNCWAE